MAGAGGALAPQAAQWQRVNVSGRYADRTGYEAFTSGSGLYLFGGTGVRRRLNDLCRLDLDTLQWGSVRAGGTMPAGRSGARGVAVGRRLFVFGGYTGRGGSYFNDLCCFDLDQERWVEMPVSSVRPEPRTDHSVANWRDERILVFGGLMRSTRYNNVYQYDIAAGEWRLMCASTGAGAGDGGGGDDARGESPRARFGHSAVCTEAAMVVFGGWDGRETLNDVWELDCLAQTWARVPVAGGAPPPRYRHSALRVRDRMLVFGGVSRFHTRFNDLFALHLGDRVWTAVASEGPAPSPRTFHRAVLVPTDVMLLVGGFDGEKRLRDVFRIAVGRQTPPPLQQLAARAVRAQLARPPAGLPEEVVRLMWGRDQQGTLRGACRRCPRGACERYDRARVDATAVFCVCEHPAGAHLEVK